MSFMEPVIDLDQTEVAEIRIDPVSKSRSLFSKKAFKKNEVIIGFMAKEVRSTPTYLTVQISDDVHIELLPECLACANHSCTPNCFFDTTSMEFIAIKDIPPGEEFTFFYPSAEWDMDQPFQCNCGSPNCIGIIQGALYLSPDTIQKYRFTDFIQQKLKLNK
jgi:SET domain-containing protein